MKFSIKRLWVVLCLASLIWLTIEGARHPSTFLSIVLGVFACFWFLMYVSTNSLVETYRSWWLEAIGRDSKYHDYQKGKGQLKW